MNEAFHPLIQFSTEAQARQYVEENYLRGLLGRPLNIVIMQENCILFDGRWVALN